MNGSYRTENYHLMPAVLEHGLAALQVDLNELQVEVFASKEQHMMQLYCSRYLNNTYHLYWRSMEWCYARSAHYGERQPEGFALFLERYPLPGAISLCDLRQQLPSKLYLCLWGEGDQEPWVSYPTGFDAQVKSWS